MRDPVVSKLYLCFSSLNIKHMRDDAIVVWYIQIASCNGFRPNEMRAPYKHVTNHTKRKPQNSKNFLNPKGERPVRCYTPYMPRYVFPKHVGPRWVNKVMPWVEQFWLEKKRYPSDSELVQKFGFTPEQLLMMHHSKFYRNSLEARGIVREPSPDLSPEQIAAITLLTNFNDRRSKEAKMAAIGVTMEQLNGWMRYPEFQRRLASAADEITEFFYPEAQVQLTKQIQNGNFQALKFYYEMTGRAQSPETVNLRQMVLTLQTILIKYIQDPEVLRAIAFEMRNALGNNGAPVAGEINHAVHHELQS